MQALPAAVVSELREHETYERVFRDGLETGEAPGALSRALEVAGFAMLRASRALRAAAPTPTPEANRG